MVAPFQILQGDALTALRLVESDSVDCIVTSPPYWGLRDYGVDGQLGLEATPQEFVRKMVEVFEECRRVLKPTGTCWVNIGDSYSDRGGKPGNENLGNPHTDRYLCARSIGLKPKNLVGIPWRLAFALQDAGWYLRQDIIWSKPNPMPESVKDRCTKAHEYIFLLTKSAKYWYEADAIREQSVTNRPELLEFGDRPEVGYPCGTQSRKRLKVPGGWDTVPGSHGTIHRSGRTEGEYADQKNSKSGQRTKADLNKNWDEAEANGTTKDGRNRRSVWSVATKGYPKAHFATFPPEIPTLCIKAGCPPSGVVLDPFAGSGTTLAVALEIGRRAIGIELNPEYVKLIEERLAGTTPSMFLEVS